MKKILLFFILVTNVFYGQNNTDNRAYKYGFVNGDGKEITSLKYDSADSFSEGIAKVSLNGKWGFINKDGKEITPVKYDMAYTCKSGVARIKLNEKYGLIDVTGKEITAIKYDNIGRFDHDVACVRINGKWGIIDNKGKELTSLQYDYMQETNADGIWSLKSKDKIMFVDENNMLIDGNTRGYFNDRIAYFDESGIAKVCLNNKWGFIDKTGKEICPLKYDYVFFFSEGMARVLLNNKWGFINELGNEVIPLIYDFKHEAFKMPIITSCGFGPVNKSVKSVYLDKNGIPVEYSDSEFLLESYMYFNHGLVVIDKSSLDRQYIFLDKKGKEVKVTKYQPVACSFYDNGRSKKQFFHDGLRKIENYEDGRKFGFADTLGKMVIPFRYGSAGDFVDGVAQIEVNEKYGLINKKGELITPFKYSSMWDFDDGIARVSISTGWYNGLCGLINKEGKEITPMKYGNIKEFNDGLAKVEFKGKIGFIDRNGKEVVLPKYRYADSFREGIAEVVLEKVGFIDKTGKNITPFKYSRTESFNNGFARVSINDKWGFINKNGQEITPLKYDATEDFQEGLAIVKTLAQ